MNIWIITDTHFGHEKMISLCGRPEGFNNLILKNLSLVKDGDILIHLGDFCIGRDEYWHNKFMGSLGGVFKWLIKGNHDNKSNTWYLAHGWDFVGAKFQDKFFGKNILFSHTPVRSQKEESGLWISNSFDLNIHGHYHNNDHRSKAPGEVEKITSKHMLLAIENTNYQPVKLETFLNSKGVFE